MNAAPSHPQPLPLPEDIRRVLQAVAKRWLLVRAGQFPLLVLALLSASWLARAALDRFFNFSWALRGALLAIDVLLVGSLFYFYVIRAFQGRLDLQAAALLVERAHPRFRTSLVSAVELARSPLGAPSLVRLLWRDVGARLRQMDLPRQTVPGHSLRRNALWAGAALLLLGTSAFFAGPVSLLLARRIFLSSAPLPTQTGVEAISREGHIALGGDFDLAARATGLVPRTAQVILTYADGHRESIAATTATEDPRLFSTPLHNVRQAFRYHFELGDGVGPEFAVSVRVPPAPGNLILTQIYPAYTGLGDRVCPSGGLSLLAGGKLRIEAIANQPLTGATLELPGVGHGSGTSVLDLAPVPQDQGLKSLNRPESLPVPVSGAGKNALRLEFPIEEGLTSFSLHLVNEKGEPSEGDIVYRVSVLQDRPPTASLSLPKETEITLRQDDSFPLAFTVRDDYGIKKAAIFYQVFRPATSGPPVPAETGRYNFDPETPRTNLTQNFTWDLKAMIPRLTIGCKVTYWVQAEDTLSSKERPSLGRSRERSFLVVSDEEKRAEFLEALGQTAKGIERLYDRQRALNEKTDASLSTH